MRPAAVQHFLGGDLKSIMLKYVVAAASVGGITLLGGQLLRMMPKEVLPELSAHDNAVLQADAELHGLMLRLRVYARFQKDAFQIMLTNSVALITLSLKQHQGYYPSMAGLPRKAASYISGIIENVRLLRAVTKRRVGTNPGVMEEFDDVAGGIQTACTNIQHNITLAVQYALTNK